MDVRVGGAICCSPGSCAAPERVASKRRGWEANGGKGAAQDANKGGARERVKACWPQAEEGGRAWTARCEEAEAGNWALDATNLWGNHLDTLAERVGLGGREGDSGMVGGPRD